METLQENNGKSLRDTASSHVEGDESNLRYTLATSSGDLLDGISRTKVKGICGSRTLAKVVVIEPKKTGQSPEGERIVGVLHGEAQKGGRCRPRLEKTERDCHTAVRRRLHPGLAERTSEGLRWREGALVFEHHDVRRSGSVHREGQRAG